MGRFPANTMFNIGGIIVPNFMRRKTTLYNWSDKAAQKTKSAKPKQFTEETKWVYWKDYFNNFIRTQTGRNDVKLYYDICDNVKPIIRNNVQLLDDYVERAPPIGEYFATDDAEFHT